MGHHISALIGTLPVDEAKIDRYDLLMYESGEYAIIGLNAYHTDFWSKKLNVSPLCIREIILDCEVTHLFAQEIFRRKEYVLLQTNYSNGTGDQAAAVYQMGQVVVPCTRARRGPINRALRHIGVERWPSLDEFETIGLDKIDDFGDSYEHYEKLSGW
ncbi:MAG: hypothetical protein AAFX93_13235 [Verrucomicrobiota bacterium]